MEKGNLSLFNAHRTLVLSMLAGLVLVLITSCSIGDADRDELISPPAAGETNPGDNLATEDVISPVPTSSNDEEVHMTPQMDPPSTPALDDLVEKAIQDLSERLTVNPDEITLVEAREVVWSNASLGCPQPGMAYADVLTPGYLIILNANNFDFEYHAGTGTEVIYCQDPEPPASGTPTDR